MCHAYYCRLDIVIVYQKGRTRADRTGSQHKDLLLSWLEEFLTEPSPASTPALSSSAGPPLSIKPIGRSLAPQGYAAMMALFNSPDNAMLIVWAQLARCVAKHGSFPRFPHVSFQMSRQGGPLPGQWGANDGDYRCRFLRTRSQTEILSAGVIERKKCLQKVAGAPFRVCLLCKVTKEGSHSHAAT